MNRQAHRQFQAQSRNTLTSENAFPGLVLARSVCTSRCADEQSPRLSDPGMEGARCVRGSLIGFGMEAAAALCLYGLWQAWHFFR
jgi:hypothetical protein